MNHGQLEMAFRLAMLDRQLHVAATTIAACWKGHVTRLKQRVIVKKRVWALWTISLFVSRKMIGIRRKREQSKAVGLLQRLCKGYLVSKRFIGTRSKIAMKVTLQSFAEMKNRIGT